MIDRSLAYKTYPADRINTRVTYRFAVAQVGVQVNVLLNKGLQRLRHCHSWLARQ